MLDSFVMEKFVLSESNFMIYAMKAYQNPHCLDIDEFHDDLKTTKYIKRLLNRYKLSGEIKERLIINHIMVLCNMFGPEASTKILFYKIDEELWSELKTFLLYLNLMPEVLDGVKKESIISSDIPVDLKIAKILREL